MHVRGKWEVDRPAVDGLDVLVIDDIYTSGGTVYSFAGALRDAGARSIRAVVLARNVGAQDAAWVLSLLLRHHDRGGRWTPSVGAYEIPTGDRPAAAPATRQAVSRRDAGARDRAQSAAREAPTRSCPPCRPRS
jgi:Phosphoribosyl transferase domain